MPAPTISQSFVKQFEREVHEAYQRQGSMLRGTVRVKNNVRGTSTTFQKTGKGSATQKARHGSVPPMNLDHTPVECTLQDWYAAEWIDKLDELKINHDERQIAVNAGAWGLGRKTDELITDQADATTTVISGGYVIITRARMLETIETLATNDVAIRPDQVTVLLSTRAWSAAMTISEFADADFVADRPFMRGFETRVWMNATWMPFTGVPGHGTATAKCLAYHKTAIGHAVGADVTTDLWWDGDKQAHKATNYMSQGSCLIDANGVVELPHDDTAAIPA